MQLTGSVKLRPVRIGFLLTPDNLATVRRIARLCNCLWGGRYNPMIPFFEDAPVRDLPPFTRVHGLDVTRAYVDFFEPDVLVEASEGMATNLGWAGDDKYHMGLPRVVTLEKFYERDYRGRVEFAAGIDVINVIQQLYDDEYKYERRHKLPFAQIEPGGDDAFFDIFPGLYPDDADLHYIADAYRQVFEPDDLPPIAETSLKLFDGGFVGPRWISQHGIEELPGRSASDETIFIFDPSNPGDVIEYWNYRLIERRVRPISVKWLSEHAAALRDLIKSVHRPIPGNPFGTTFHTSLRFGSAIADRAVEIMQLHFADLPQGSFFPGRASIIWPAMTTGNPWRETRILVAAESHSFDEKIGSDGHVKIPAPAPRFLNAARTYTRSRWMNVVVPSSYRNDDVAIVYPSNVWKPDYPRLGMGLREVTVTREGWAIPQEHSIGYSLLSPVDGRAALIGWFKANGIEASPSEEGQIAAQIIAGAGNLLACGMFSDHATLSLLNSMAESIAERQRNGEQVRAVTPDRAKHIKTVQHHFDQRSKHSIGFWNKLDYFLERSVFRAGLRVQCPTCAHYNWFAIDAISYTPTCARCLKQFALPQAPEDLTRIQWFYRVIGPFAAPDYARGGYAVALTLRCIAKRHESAMTWSTGLILQNLNCEIDFAGWYRRSSLVERETDEPIVFFGEAKSFGKNSIDDHAVASLRQVADHFPGAMMIVSSLRRISDYSPDEIRRLRELATWGRMRMHHGRPQNPLVVLTDVELFSEHSISNAWKNIGGLAAQLVAHPSVDLSDLHELAELTQRLYLGLPGSHEHYYESLRSERARLVQRIRTRSTSDK
jgi:hypothetical protein